MSAWQIPKLMNILTKENESFSKESGRSLECEVSLNSEKHPFLEDHSFQGTAVVPGMLLTSMAITLFEKIHAHASVQLRNFKFENAIIVTKKDESPMSAALVENEQTGEFDFTISELNANALYASGSIRIGDETGGAVEQSVGLSSGNTTRSAVQVYDRFKRRQNQYGPSFRGVLEIDFGENEAVGKLASPDGERSENWMIDPCLLDWCIQVLALADRDEERTFALSGFKEFNLYSRDFSEVRVQAKINERRSDSLIGDIDLFNKGGQLVLQIEDVELKYLETHHIQNIVVTSNFTADPVSDTLDFWGRQFDMPVDVQFAPYNQVFQQLLDPNSLVSKNEQGVNVLMLKLDDWIEEKFNLKLKCSPKEQDELLEGIERYSLAPEVQIGSLNKYESKYLHTEIFVDRAYCRYGIDFSDATCVLDIGANIGLFSLFCESESPGVKVLSFEPSPPVYNLLSKNISMYAPGAKALNMGVSGTNGEAEFTYYSNSSVFSTFYADEQEDHDAIEAVVKNVLEEELGKDADTDYYAEALTEGRTSSETFVCQLRTVSHIIREENLEHIDILKVDAEKSELEVIRGIEDEHWPIIRQVVLEVHDSGQGEIEEATDLLKKHGFEVSVIQEKLLEKSGLYGVYGTRKKADGEGLNEELDKGSQERKLMAVSQEFLQSLRVANQRVGVPTLVCLTPTNISDSESSLAETVKSAEQLISDEIQSMDATYLLPCHDLQKRYKLTSIFDSQSNIMGHIPYTPECYAALATEVFRATRSLITAPKKALVLDCDNTIWKGVCGEQSPEDLLIESGHSAIQKLALACRNRGIVLCLASKNEEEDVRKVFNSRTDMTLQWEHLSAWRVNWKSKSENLVSLASELNIGLDSFVFLDDNPVECAEVKSACPEVLSICLPNDSVSIEHLAHHLWALDRFQVTQEDKKRADFYRQEKERKALQGNLSTLANFIESLELKVEIFEPQPEDYDRVSQLTQRTNQFNFYTTRYTNEEVREIAECDDRGWLLVKVRDRFGDYGSVGVACYQVGKATMSISDFMISCRVLGRGVEHKVISALGSIALEKGCEELVLNFRRSEKNEPALNFLTSLDGQSDFESLVGIGLGSSRSINLSAQKAIEVRFDPNNEGDISGGERRKSVSAVSIPTANGIFEMIPGFYTTGASIYRGATTSMMKPRPKIEEVFVAPESDMQKEISSVWCGVLRLEGIGVDDDFFNIGGTSLLAVQVASELSEKLGQRISTVSIFEGRTIRVMAASLDGSSQKESEAKIDASSDRGRERRAKRKRRGRS